MTIPSGTKRYLFLVGTQEYDVGLVGLLVDVRSSQALDEVANCVSGA